MDIKDFRHHLHCHPELSFEEHQTSAFISERLSEMGIEHRPIAGTGILARIEGRRGNLERCVVLRAEMDALPIKEMTGVEYASQREGVMHACGHDCHQAMLYGVLKRMQMERDFEGTLLAVFQPAEEAMSGGAVMVLEENPFEKYKVAAVVGQHLDSDLDVGQMGFCPGKFMASEDVVRFKVRAAETEGSMRKQDKSIVVAMADLILRLNTLNSEVCVLSIGSVETFGLQAEEAEKAAFTVKMRAFGEKLRQRVKDMIANIAEEIEYKYDVEVELDIKQGYPCVENDVQLTYEAMLLSESLGFKAVDLEMRLAGDDFGCYAQAYPSLYYRLGVGRGAGRLHTATFMPDDRVLAVGEEFMYRLALNILNK